MKVLWIARAGDSLKFKAVVQNQLNSFNNSGKNVEIIAFSIIGSSSISYIRCVFPLIITYRKVRPDLIHTHYSFSGFLAGLLFPTAHQVVSLMGSDVEGGSFRKFIISVFSRFVWNKTIVKSIGLKKKIGHSSAVVIPNGVDLDRFKPLDMDNCRNLLGWELDKKQILFFADPSRREKNFELAKQAFSLLKDEKIELKVIYGIPLENAPIAINAASVIILTSLWEGSPNVVKEAMACNKPIVSTKVGDVEWLLGNVDGHYIAEFKAEDVASKLNLALDFSISDFTTLGRSRIELLGLDSKSVAEKLYKTYCDIIND